MDAERATEDARRIVAGLDLDERIRLLSGRDAWHLEGVAEAGLAPLAVADGPHGVRRKRDGAGDATLGDAEPATCFPTAVTLGATWDEGLLTEVGAALGAEAAAQDVAVLLGPGLNLKRHPAGGRNFEYLSEDPLLAGRLAAALVRGIQGQGVGACLKHLAANHQEHHRMSVDTVVDERTLRELELAGFEHAVAGGAPWTVMHAYNRLNGVFCGEHRWLLTEVLREQWGFDGLVMSDWGATSDRAAGIAAGSDLEMPGSNGAFDDEVRAALAEGRLSADDVARSATRVVALLRRAHAARESRGAAGEVDADAHHDLARRVAAAGSVLLANDGTLPLDLAALTARPGGLAVVGAFAAHPRYQGAGSSQVTPTRVCDALTALRARVAGDGLRYAPGYDPLSGATTPHLVAEAAEAAAAAEVAVVFAGLPGAYESEGFDREHLRLPEGHTALIEAVLSANPRTVVVLANGAPVELPWADRAAAILEGYLGGQAGGEAVAEVLVGEAEPGGRLAESFPVAQRDLPADAHFAAHPSQVEHREGLAVGYRFHTTAGVPARYPFGHGLAYTSFAYGRLEVSGQGTDREVAVEITNTGSRAGSEVVQLYVGQVAPAVPRPLRELAGFAKVRLEPGETATVRLPLDARAFALWDVRAGDWRVPSGAYEVEVGSSATDVRARARVEVVAEAEPGPSATPVAAAADDAAFAAALGRRVPTPAGPRPFDRDSTVDDLAATRAGALLQRALLALLRRRIAADVGADAATRRFYEAAVLEAPLRALVILAGGRPPLRVLDALCAVLDGRAPWRPVPRPR